MRTRSRRFLIIAAVLATANAAHPLQAAIRVFMAIDGEQANAPLSGPNTIDVAPGNSQTVMAWIEATVPGNSLNGYQLIMTFNAEPLDTAEGSVDYVDNNPGAGGGDSMVIDFTRPDWVYASNPFELPPAYNETPASNIFGVIYNTIGGFEVDPATLEIAYFFEFDILVSENACGIHEMRFVLPPKNPPLSVLFNPNGAGLPVEEWQQLRIDTGPCAGNPCDGVDCSGLDDDCNLGVCNPDTGVCEAQSTNEGLPCEDGDNCTTGDTCAAGSCEGVTPDCSEFDDACNIGVCNPDTGSCEAEATNEGLSCEDGDNCTEGDACANGTCMGQDLDCSAFDDDCNLGVCNKTKGACEAQTTNEGGTCSDGDNCTVGDICTRGSCEGLPTDCSEFDDECSIGVCIPETGACEAERINNGTACDDGDDCTVEDVCTDGSCIGMTLDCTDFDDDCNVGVCNEAGDCEAQPDNEGGLCNGGQGTCMNGMCEELVCTSDADCQDESACNGAETCNLDTGACMSGTPVSCASDESCEEPDGVCVPVDIECNRSMYVVGLGQPVIYNPRGAGTLSLILTGDEDFEPWFVHPGSIRLRRCDGIGGGVEPLDATQGPPPEVSDLRRPYDGEFTCGEDGRRCSRSPDPSPDGIRDLRLHFSRSKINQALDIKSLSRGDIVVIELRGLAPNGELFCARECLRIGGDRGRFMRRPPWSNGG